MNKALKLIGSISLVATAAACGATSNGNGTGEPTPTPTPGVGATIANIQQGNVTAGSEVTLENVVVTAIRPGNNGVDFFAQDAGGGAYSGIYFFDQDGLSPAELAIGDEINVVGTFTEFESGTTGGTISEIKPSSIEIVNTGLTPTIDTITAANIGTELADAGAAEKWEGCLIEIDGSVNVSNTAVGFGEYVVTNGTATFRVDDMIVDTLASRFSNEELTYVAGVWHYSFDNYKLLPRLATDVVGSTPPAAVPVPVADLQDPAVAPASGTMVRVENAIVTGIAEFTNAQSETRRSFWIQQGTTAGAKNGIYVFDQSFTGPAVAVGDVLTFDAQFMEFGTAPNTLSELVIKTTSPIPAPVSTGSTPVVLTVTLAELVANAELYEGVLVQLDANVTVNSMNPDTTDYKEYTVTNGTQTLRVNDLAFFSRPQVSMGATLTTVRGQLNYANGNFKLEPRVATDIVKQ